VITHTANCDGNFYPHYGLAGLNRFTTPEPKGTAISHQQFLELTLACTNPHKTPVTTSGTHNGYKCTITTAADSCDINWAIPGPTNKIRVFQIAAMFTAFLGTSRLNGVKTGRQAFLINIGFATVR
jgi:hypothetical protein